MDYTTFTKETFNAFREMNREGPVQMLNFIRLHDVAQEDVPTKRSGREAYAAYSRISAPVIAAIGVKIVWRGDWELGLIGPDGERWDICFVAEYPSVQSFANMFKDPVYREAMMHRQAAVRDSRLVRLAPAPHGNTFDGQ